MRSGLVSVILVLLFVAVPFGQMFSEELESLENSEFAASTPFDILMYGNSYTSANNLASLVQEGLVSGGVATNVDSLTGGGMTLDGHSQNAQSSGHSWNTTLNDGTAWDYVILQDQSQIPGFYRSTAYWQDSLAGAQVLDGFAEDVGAESILMMTWGRRDGDSTNQEIFPDFLSMQERLEYGYIDYRDNLSTPNRDVWIAPVGLAFKHIYENVQASGATPENSGNLFYDLYTSDGSHPSLSGSYLASCVLYATITGNSPVGLTDSISLSSSIKLDLQEAAAATVFNETNHISYSWQITSSSGNNISVIETGLAFEWVEQHGEWSVINDVLVSNSGDIYAVGTHKSIPADPHVPYIVDQCEFHQEMYFFVIKLDSLGACQWISNVTGTTKESQMYEYTTNEISIDSQDNIYITGDLVPDYYAIGDSIIYYFGNHSFDASSCWVNGVSNPQTFQCSIGFVAKLNNSGVWQWVKTGGDAYNQEFGQSFKSLETYPNGTSIVGGQYTDEIVLGSFSDNRNSNGGDLDIFVGMIDTNGTWIWVDFVGQAQTQRLEDLTIDVNGDIFVTGSTYAHDSITLMFDDFELQTDPNNQGTYSTFVGKINKFGEWQWAKTWDHATSTSTGNSVTSDSNGNVIVAGYSYGTNSANGLSISSSGNQNGFVTKLDGNGNWLWLKHIACVCINLPSSLVVDTYDDIIVTGTYTSLIQFDSIQLPTVSGGSDIFVAKINSTGIWKNAFGAGSASSEDYVGGMSIDNNGNIFLSGIIDCCGQNIFGSIINQNVVGDEDWFVAKISRDYDFDSEPDAIDDDDDNDYIIDILDSCPFSPLGFESIGAFDHDSDGCRDSDEDDDDDGDMLNDTNDSCPKGMTGWVTSNVTDIDGDGCMDSLEDFDDDADGFEDYEDLCPRTMGNSTFEFEKGCLDTDGDTRPDIRDPFPENDLEWSDLDSDGTGDNSDEFPLDSTQISDADKDEFGDEEFGNNGDSCPLIFGTSTIDRRGCVDTDGDGWSDAGDDFPENPAEYLDTDGDTVPDHLDAFPFDPTQKQDTDGDGYGDNADGNLGDAFPNDPSRHADSDRDSYDDDSDAFPFDPTQWSDADGDEYGDNPLGLRPDAFPLESSQWSDVDGDGWGDNASGNHPDAFPTDITQWIDIDGDGYGDNPFGINPDAYPKDPTQWADFDEDGYGDNPNGTNPDPFVNDTDNDGYNNSIDPLPNIATPGDLDGDMCLDEMDEFPSNPNECKDSDGDGWGDNQDSDDDNDGVNDITELQEGTDPMDPSSVPVESFEIVVAGNIGLGAWDLLGIFGGVPFFSWLAFCLVTRGSRSRRYEKLLFESKTEEELADISRKYEFALMLRLVGPHHALRLERIRSNLEVHFNEIERKIVEDPDFNLSKEEHVMPPSIEVQGMIHTDGYEWTDHMGFKWYRVPDTGSDWSRWQ